MESRGAEVKNQLDTVFRMNNVSLEDMCLAIQPVLTHIKPNNPDDDEAPDIDEYRATLSSQLE